MLKSTAILSLLLLAAFCPVQTAKNDPSPARKRTLILIDNASFFMTHSEFFKLFNELEHHVRIEVLTSKSIVEGHVSLEVDKELAYDNVIFMAASLPELPETKQFNLPRFFEKGGNIFFILDADVSPFFRDYFKKFGFSIEKSGSYLVDYERALEAAKPEIFQVHAFKDIGLLVEGVKGPLVYSGQGLETTIFENTQINVLARGNLNTASVHYSSAGFKSTNKLGRNNQLILGIQGIEDGRIVVSGSVDMFSNSFYQLSKGENKVYSKNLLEWLSFERGVVRKTGYSYSCIDKDGKDSECPRKSRFRFSIDLESWNWSQKKWLPYSDSNVVLELTMMSPKWRQVLTESTTKKGHYSVVGLVPYRMGTYRFKISHARPGWNRVSLYKKLAVRNKNFVEYVKNWPRDFVPAVGMAAVLASFALISYIFLYNDDRVSLAQ